MGNDIKSPIAVGQCKRVYVVDFCRESCHSSISRGRDTLLDINEVPPNALYCIVMIVQFTLIVCYSPAGIPNSCWLPSGRTPDAGSFVRPFRKTHDDTGGQLHEPHCYAECGHGCPYRSLIPVHCGENARDHLPIRRRRDFLTMLGDGGVYLG